MLLHHTDTLTPITPRQCFSRMGFSLLLLFFTTLAVQTLLSLLCSAFAPQLWDTNWIDLTISSLAMYGVGVPLAYLPLRRVPCAIPAQQPMSPARFVRITCIAFSVLVAGNLLGMLLTEYIQYALQRKVSDPVDMLLQGNHLLASFIALVLLAPLFEELFFRRLLVSRLLPFGGRFAMVFSALLFGLFHGNFSQFFYAFGVGLILAYLYIRTGSLGYSIFLHVFINFFTGFLPFAMLESSTQLPWGNILLSMLLLTAAILGIVFLVKNARYIYLPAPLCAPPQKRAVLGNFGMIAFLLLCVVLFALSF